MKTQTVRTKRKCVYCRFEGECAFKKTVVSNGMSEHGAGYAICTWKDQCNQQTYRQSYTVEM